MAPTPVANSSPNANSESAANSDSNDHFSFFRCPVSKDQSQALIRIGRRALAASVQETSIDGFTVLVSPKSTSRLKVGRPWVLEYDGARTEVHPQWMFNSPDGHVQVGLRRLRDLTKPPPVRRAFGKARTRIHNDSNFAAVAFGGFVMGLFLLMAMPGLGDRLGTSQRIQSAFRWILSEASITIDQIL